MDPVEPHGRRRWWRARDRAVQRSRTLLFDIDTLDWSPDLLDLFGVPHSCLAGVLPSSGRFGVTAPECAAGLAVPVSGIAGDQQAALFGQACFTPGMTKNTYGTGSFVLVNLGSSRPPPRRGAAHHRGVDAGWRCDDVTYTRSKARSSLLVRQCNGARRPRNIDTDVGGRAARRVGARHRRRRVRPRVHRPRLAVLGSVRSGAIVGLTAAPTRAHIARAAIEAMAWQTADVVDAMRAAAGVAIAELRADRGASRDEPALSVPSRRARRARAAAGRAPRPPRSASRSSPGIAEGVWPSPAEPRPAGVERDAPPTAPRPRPRPPARAVGSAAVDRAAGQERHLLLTYPSVKC